MNPFHKNLALWLVITLMMIMLYNLFNQQHVAETSISYTEFLAMIESERVSDVVIQGNELFVTDINRNNFKVYAPEDGDLIKVLRELEESYHVMIHAEDAVLAEMRITSTYREQSIDAILETIGTAFGLTVSKKEDHYYLNN